MTGIEAALLAAGYGATAAYTIATIANIALALALSAVSMGLQALLKPKPNSGSLSGRRQELQTSAREPTKAREIVIGKVRKGGVFVCLESVDNETNLLMAIALAGMEVQAIDEIFFFDELAVNQAGVVQPKFRHEVSFEKFLGTDVQAASTLLLSNNPKWTGEHRLDGIAYTAFNLEFNRDVFNQIPNVSAIIRGAKMFDPRDSTTKYSTNPALAIAYYLNHPLYGLGAAYGTDIDNDMLIAAANECDEDVAIKAGKTLEFDGVDDVVNMGPALNQTGSFTIEARVRPAVVNRTGMGVLGKLTDSLTGFWLTIENDKVSFLTYGLSNVILETAPGHMVVDTWKHIAAVYDATAGTKTIYVDGVSVASVSGVTGAIAANSGDLAAGFHFQGRIQDVRLWSDARTPTEVAAFDDKTLTGSETNLAGYWPLNEKRGFRAEDATETANDGIISGAIWVDDDEILGTEKRYSANGVIFSDQNPGEIIEELLTAMVGSCVFSGGVWLIRAGAFESPTVTLTENDARDSIKIQPKRSRRDLFNAVRGTFIAPENEYQPSDFPLITNPGFEAQDGGSRIVQDIELPYTTSSSMAQRIAWLHLLRNREQVSCVYRAKLSALRLRAGDTVSITNSHLGWEEKDFEVINWALVGIEDADGNPGLGVDLELRETNAAIYDFNPATDEVPLNPSPDSNLPSPFGEIAMVSAFIERTGFTEIASAEGQGVWPGTIMGFVFNPLTGHLNVDDMVSAAGDNFDVFDQYVQTPAPSAHYETPEIDCDFDDVMRTFAEYEIVKGPGEVGAFKITHKFDYRKDGEEYAGWQILLKSAKVEARYIKHRLDFDFSRGTGGILRRFEAVVDKTTVFQGFSDVIVPVGGKDFVFDQRYHHIPALGFGVKSGAARTVSFPNISTEGFTAVVFDAASDAGGIISVNAQGV